MARNGLGPDPWSAWTACLTPPPVGRTLPVRGRPAPQRPLTGPAPYPRTRGVRPTPSSLPRDWWGPHWSPPRPRSIVELLRAGSLDSELAALLWLWLEARLPVVIAAGPPLAGKSTLLTALLAFLPTDARRFFLQGAAEDFRWLPEAEALGWHRPASSAESTGAEPSPRERRLAAADPARAYLLAAELSDHLAAYTWGAAARLLVRAAGRGYGFGATIHAESLGEVLEQLQARPVGLSADELRSLGIVLVLGVARADQPRPAPWWDAEPAAPRRRVVAAHYVRPLERDAGGHLRRRPPAVLTTWEPEGDRFEHFAWGVLPELAERVGRAAADFERERARRAAFLGQLVTGPRTSPGEVAEAIAAFARPVDEPVRPDRSLRPSPA